MNLCLSIVLRFFSLFYMHLALMKRLSANEHISKLLTSLKVLYLILKKTDGFSESKILSWILLFSTKNAIFLSAAYYAMA